MIRPFLIVAIVVAVLLQHRGPVANEEVAPPAGAADEKAAAKEVLDLLRRQPTLSFDTAPVHFYINGTLFAVPRNMIAYMPEHVVEGPGAPPDVANLSNRVILHVMLPDMVGLTEANAECYVRGSDCKQLVRITITEETPGTAVIPRANEGERYQHWGGSPVEMAEGLWAFPVNEGTGRRYFLGRLGPDTSVLFRCNVRTFLAPLCSMTTGAEIGKDTLRILFNKAQTEDWRFVYKSVLNLISTFRVEN
ncbi:MAG: hypothetical protein AB7S71_05825 [Dongiaceae bacterium]